MELREAIEKRASVRQFSSDSINADHLREMVRLAGLAPSINNSQPWRFIAITNSSLKRKMADIVHAKINHVLPDANEEQAKKAKAQVDWFSTFFNNAPAVIVVATCPYSAIVDNALVNTALSHEDMNAMRGHPDVESIGAALENLLLAAVDLGYGACWLSGPMIANKELEAELELANPWRLAAMIAIGKPSAVVKQRDKKPVDEIFELRA